MWRLITGDLKGGVATRQGPGAVGQEFSWERIFTAAVESKRVGGYANEASWVFHWRSAIPLIAGETYRWGSEFLLCPEEGSATLFPYPT